MRARHFVSGLFSVKSVDPHWKFSWSRGLKCRLKARVLRLPETFLHNQVRICVLYFRSWRLMFYPGFKVPSWPEHVLFRSIRNHLTLILKREHLKPDAGFNLCQFLWIQCLLCPNRSVPVNLKDWMNVSSQFFLGMRQLYRPKMKLVADK